MPWLGLVMLLMVACGIIATGLPAALVLIAVASFGAIVGIATGEVPVELVGALPSRLINLFENDLLQALPLYVTMGLLLDRLPVADALYPSHFLTLTIQVAGSVSFGLERKSICLSQPLEHRFERSEHRSRQSYDRPDRDTDRPSCTFRPVGHREPRDQPPDHLPTLDEQLLCRRMQRLEWNFEIARHQPPRRIPPRRISDCPAFRPDSQMANGFCMSIARPVRLYRGCERQRQRLRVRLPVQCHDVSRRPLRPMQRRRDGVHMRQHRRVIGVLLDHHEDVHNPLLKMILLHHRTTLDDP